MEKPQQEFQLNLENFLEQEQKFSKDTTGIVLQKIIGRNSWRNAWRKSGSHRKKRYERFPGGILGEILAEFLQIFLHKLLEE